MREEAWSEERVQGGGVTLREEIEAQGYVVLVTHRDHPWNGSRVSNVELWKEDQGKTHQLSVETPQNKTDEEREEFLLRELLKNVKEKK